MLQENTQSHEQYSDGGTVVQQEMEEFSKQRNHVRALQLLCESYRYDKWSLAATAGIAKRDAKWPGTLVR